VDEMAIADFYGFIASAILISFSGVMSPGPFFAVTIAKGFESKFSGIILSLGHGVVEFPLMFLIYYFGIEWISKSLILDKTVSFVGGAILIYMGMQMLKTRKEKNPQSPYLKYGAFVAGILATATNPYFLLWWSTVGINLVGQAANFQLIGFVIFTIVHWSCDLIWNSIVSLTVFKSKQLWTKRVHHIVFGFCFLVFVGFGAWFTIRAFIL
jgi:threonine/homoserine/homoserine lactone efflux protein